MTFQRRCGALVVAFSLTCSPARAAICIPPAVLVENSYQYILSLTEALTYAKSALDRTIPARRGSVVDDFELLLALKLGKSDFECAKSHVSPYTASPHEVIKTSARGATAVFTRLVDLNDRSVKEYTAFLDSLGDRSVKPGTVLEKQAELGAAYDEVWNLLITAVIAGTYAVVEEDPSTGRMSGLALTAAERDVVLQRLISTFGSDVKGGIRAGQGLLLTAASALYQVVGDPKRKPRIQR